MPWNSTSPTGSISVKANRTPMQQNTTYIEDTMGNSVVGTNTVTTRDHFWDVGSDEDGRHRFIQSVGFTDGLGDPADPLIGTGMDGVMYLKEDELTPSRVQGFYRNAQGIYQFIPAFKTGTVVIASASSPYGILTSVPPRVYGQVFLFDQTIGQRSGQMGIFRSNATICEGWSLTESIDGADTSVPVKLASGSKAIDLNLRVRNSDASSGHTWEYRLIYWAL